MQYKIRSLTSADQPLLWEMLHLATFVPPGYPPPERSTLEHPDSAKYVRDWGRDNDSGFVAVDANNQPLGAVWLRLFVGEEKGISYIDDFTPELGIAIFPEYRGQGIGTSLLTRLIEASAASYEQISLSVMGENPAVRLYERLGFEVVARVGPGLVMRRKSTSRDLCGISLLEKSVSIE
jgi:ribosomal protein S18 acetylase RimI-like enzyme